MSDGRQRQKPEDKGRACSSYVFGLFRVSEGLVFPTPINEGKPHQLILVIHILMSSWCVLISTPKTVLRQLY